MLPMCVPVCVCVCSFVLNLTPTHPLVPQGKTNNQMLRDIMELKGKPSTKFIRRGQFHARHFDEDLNFVLVEVDKVTNKVRIGIGWTFYTAPKTAIRPQLDRKYPLSLSL